LKRPSEKAPASTPRKPRGRPATRRLQADGIERDDAVRRRIIRAAAEIYRECGYDRAAMIDIARRVGMTAPALYWYFRSKEAILVAFLEHTIADLIQFVRSLVHSSDPRERLWEFMHAYVLWQLQQQELSAAYERIHALGHLRNSLPDKQRRRVTALEREFYGFFRDLVAHANGGALRPGEVASITFGLIGMVEHLISWFRPTGRLSVRQIATQYANLAVAMATAAGDKPGVALAGKRATTKAKANA